MILMHSKTYLLIINSQQIQQLSLQHTQLILDNQLPEEFLAKFTDIERKVLYFLMIGCSISIIVAYTGISEVRINQILRAIKECKAWELLR